jgi:FkbM family methyltransferase
MKPTRLMVAQKVCRPLPPLVAQRLRDRIYPPAQAYRDDYPFVVRAQTGSLLKSRTGILQAYPFSVHGYYDWRNCAIASAICAPGDTIVEVGANIGTETTCFADIVGPTGKVCAFEPLPANVSALHETFRLNRDRNITVFPYAVGDECKQVRFSTPATKHNFGDGRILVGGQSGENGPGGAWLDVECVTLDSMADRIGPVRMMFVEAEGAEVMVFRGAERTIRAHTPGIVFEATPKLLARAGYTLQDLYDLMRGYGYEAFRISLLGLVGIRSVEGEVDRRPTNWLCLHSSQLHLVNRVKSYLARCGLLPCVPGLNPLARQA